MNDASPDSDLVKSITPDVLQFLRQIGYFELLDARFCPADSTQEGTTCVHSFEATQGILVGLGMSAEDIQDVLHVLNSQGACCDCEVLFNVAEESRLKAKYWKTRHVEGREQ